MLRISDIRGTRKFKTRSKIQGVPVPYIVEDIRHQGGFFKKFQVFVRKLLDRVILGLWHPGDLLLMLYHYSVYKRGPQCLICITRRICLNIKVISGKTLTTFWYLFYFIPLYLYTYFAGIVQVSRLDQYFW